MQREQPAELSGWGRFPVVEGVERVSEHLEQASAQVALSRGLGRSYGDASLPAASGAPVLSTRLADLCLAFDAGTGSLRTEAGVSLRELNRIFLPRCWAVPVYPGTQDVTVGGMVASDVHGKNHHLRGSFGDHVTSFRLRLPDGGTREVTDTSDPELFAATIGGLGLTGHILEVEFTLEQIPSPLIWREIEIARDLSDVVSRLRAASAAWPFTVAWLDMSAPARALGRGVVIRGRWSTDAAPASPDMDTVFSIPFEFPDWVVQRLSILLFNRLWYGLQAWSASSGICSPRRFFFPLDSIANWNRLYGRKGFVQYQCIVPHEAAVESYRVMLEECGQRGAASPITVLKDCGREGRGMISFPMPGVSLAVDLPMLGEPTRELVRELNAIVIGAGGRIYLTKDSLTTPEELRAMDPRIDAFLAYRNRLDPERRIDSLLADRLFG